MIELCFPEITLVTSSQVGGKEVRKSGKELDKKLMLWPGLRQDSGSRTEKKGPGVRNTLFHS